MFNLIYYPLGVYLVVKNTDYSRQLTIKLMKVITGIGTYLGLTGICEHFDRLQFLVWPRYILDKSVGIQFGRVRGPFASSVPMGEWLVVVFIAASLLLHFTEHPPKFFLYSLMLIVMAGIYFTNTRGIWLSFGAVLLTTMAFRGKLGRQSWSIVLLVVLAFLIGAGNKFSYGQETLFSKRQETVNYRLANYQTAYKMGMDNFISGVGYGNFPFEWMQYFGPAERALIPDLTDGNHNTYLGLFAETGFLGLLLYVVLLLCLAGKCFLIWRQRMPGEEFEKNICICSLSMVFIIAIESMFGDQRFDATYNTLMYLFIGIAASMKASAVQKEALPLTASVPAGGNPALGPLLQNRAISR